MLVQCTLLLMSSEQIYKVCLVTQIWDMRWDIDAQYQMFCLNNCKYLNDSIFPMLLACDLKSCSKDVSRCFGQSESCPFYGDLISRFMFWSLVPRWEVLIPLVKKHLQPSWPFLKVQLFNLNSCWGHSLNSAMGKK